MQKIRIGKIGKTITGKTPSSKCPEDFGTNYLFITPSDDFDNKFIWKTERYLSEGGLEKLKNKILPKNTILVTCIGSAMGKVAINKKTAISNQQINAVIPDEDQFDPDYVYYLFKNNYKNFRNAAVGSTAVPLLNKTEFDNLEFKVHKDINTQGRISKILSALDAKIALNNRINEVLEAKAKLLYDYWFVQFEFPASGASAPLSPLDGSRSPRNGGYKSSGGKMVYHKKLKREIPEGWEVKSFGDYCPSVGGYAFKSTWWTTTGNPVVKIKNIQEDNSIDLNDIDFIDSEVNKVPHQFIAKPGSVLIAMTGATIGKFGIVPYSKKEIYVNQRVGHFDLGNKPYERLPFLINSLSQEYVRKEIFRIASGAAQPNISNEQINSIKLLIPSEEVIEQYNQLFSSYYKRILLNQKQNQHLSSLRDWLLPMLMNGQVGVERAYEIVDGELGMVAEPGETYE